METKKDLNFSLRNVPDTWEEAALEGPQGDDAPLRRKRVVGKLPQRYEMDAMTAFIAGASMTIVAGAAWYFLEIDGAVVSPWLAVMMGMLIAVAVRLGAGQDHPEVRASLSVIFYLVGVFTVAYMIERHQFISLYGPEASIAGGERGLVRDRLTEPLTLAAWACGLVVAAQTSYLFKRRRISWS